MLAYLGLGLNFCKKDRQKTKIWPLNCQDCEYSNSICEKIKGVTPRTRRAILKYVSALQHLAELKARSQGKSLENIDFFELMFESFKLIGAYQGCLNPQILRAEYYEENARMMEDVVNEIRDEFNKTRPYMELSISCSENYRETVTQFYEDSTGKIFPLSRGFLKEVGAEKGLKGEKAKRFVQNAIDEMKKKIIEPYNKAHISLDWFPKLIDYYHSKL